MIYVLLLEQNKIYVGYSARPVGERFLEHFNANGSKWTSLYRPLQVLSVHEGGLREENELTLQMMDKYGWWNVRGGHWCQVEISSCPPALLQWQQLQLPVPLKSHRENGEISTTTRSNPISKQSRSGGNGNGRMHCTRCLRNSHFVDSCFANTDINGRPLQKSKSSSNVATPSFKSTIRIEYGGQNSMEQFEGYSDTSDIGEEYEDYDSFSSGDEDQGGYESCSSDY